ncbi:cell envelope-related function transcriptional attenuator common domain-containing protein [Lentibacillus persicus]|uniref:Cell envelope-related function transcriptional attenuator common domain-containing protein n=1 Tax=Lentibacillus persicus TaxID=640948 RepID=A0A1I1W3N2_9BACI|nr:LCP family protein [Lentibacillus persicus]SFD89767.1 cell envelope-related function transcriptional attenuator common domain-containing protein [Lentibacillus persicus]
MEKRRNRYKSKPKRKKWLWITLSVILLLAAAAAYGYSIWRDVQNTVATELHEPVDGIDTEATKKKVDGKEPINILLLGVDERSHDKGRSDTMIVMTLDPANQQMQLVSIPRDTRTEIVGRGMVDKLNHAYAFGGSEMSVASVENFLDIDLDYYVRMNMEGLAQLVNAVNGITVTNDRAFSQGGHSFGTGELQLNGEEALAYVRMRKGDTQGDLGRNERQRQVIQGIIDKGANFNILNKIGDIMDVLGDNMATNMKFDDMRNLATNYRSARKNITTYQMSGQGTRINGIYYMLMSDEEVRKVHDMITTFGE